MATDRMPAGLSTRRNGMGSSGWQRHRAGPRPLDKGEASRLYTLKSQVLLLKLGCVLKVMNVVRDPPGAHHQAAGVVTRRGRLVMTRQGW